VAGGTTRVAMTEGIAFDPERLSVAAGTTVRWTYEYTFERPGADSVQISSRIL
jgi:plastocyanin